MAIDPTVMASSQTPPDPIPPETDQSSRDRSAESSNTASREGSRPPKKKQNVRFTPGGESLDSSNQKAVFDIRDESNAPPKPKPLPRPRLGSGTFQRSGDSSLTRRSGNEHSEDITDETVRAPVRKARLSAMSLSSSDSDSDSDSDNSSKPFLDKGKQKMTDVTAKDQRDYEDNKNEGDEITPAKALSQKSAQERAERLSRKIGTHSAPSSRYTSPQRPQRMTVRSPPPSPPQDGQEEMPIDLNNIPLEKLKTTRTKFGIEDDTDEEEEEDAERKPPKKKRKNRFLNTAARLVGRNNDQEKAKLFKSRGESPEFLSGTQTPIYERDPDHYVPRPREYREGYLSSLLKLYEQEGLGSAISRLPSSLGDAARVARQSSSGLPLLGASSRDGGVDTPEQTPVSTPGISPTSSGTTTPKQKRQKWYYQNPASQSTGALSDLVSSSTVFAQPGSSKQSSAVRPKPKHTPLSQHAMDKMRGKKAERDEMLIRIHMEGTEQRHKYLVSMCQALMQYGAPTHRLEGKI